MDADRPVPARLPLLVLVGVALLVGCSTAPRQPKEVVDTKNRASGYAGFGNRAYAQGDYAAAATFFQQGLALNLSVDNQPGVVQSLCSIGKVHVAVGQLDEAEEVFRRASRLAEALRQPSLEAQCATSLAELLLQRESNAEARDLLVRALAHEKELAGTRDLAVIYHTLGVAEKKLGALDQAQAHLETALAANRALGAAEEVGSNLYVLASVLSKRGDYAGALKYAEQALETDKGVENSLGIAQDLLALGIISTRLGKDEEAFSYLERSHGIYSALRVAPGLRSVLPYLVESARKTGRAPAAEVYAAELRSLEKP
jgi:tetratricopeptide (TPR) repeat protein